MSDRTLPHIPQDGTNVEVLTQAEMEALCHLYQSSPAFKCKFQGLSNQAGVSSGLLAWHRIVVEMTAFRAYGDFGRLPEGRGEYTTDMLRTHVEANLDYYDKPQARRALCGPLPVKQPNGDPYRYWKWPWQV